MRRAKQKPLHEPPGEPAEYAPDWNPDVLEMLAALLGACLLSMVALLVYATVAL